jgi:hypothetical protein
MPINPLAGREGRLIEVHNHRIRASQAAMHHRNQASYRRSCVNVKAAETESKREEMETPVSPDIFIADAEAPEGEQHILSVL